MHTAEESFALLPEDVIQVEQDCRVEFKSRAELDTAKLVPVAWVWSGAGVTAGSVCVKSCYPTSTQEWRCESHKTKHTKV